MYSSLSRSSPESSGDKRDVMLAADLRFDEGFVARVKKMRKCGRRTDEQGRNRNGHNIPVL